MKYKRFKRWVFTVKLRIPPKADKDQVEEQATPHAAAIKMLETPITHKSPSSLTCFSCDAMRADSVPESRSVGKRTPTKLFVVSPRRSPLSPNRRILNTPQ